MTSIRDFAIGVVPGLLQTAQYGEESSGPWALDMSAEALLQLLQARLERQRRVLREAGTRFTAIVDESALRRVVGGPVVVQDQLKALVTASELPNVAIRIVPFASGPLPVPTNKFIIPSFDVPPDVVFLETLTGRFILVRETDLAFYHEACASLEGFGPAE